MEPLYTGSAISNQEVQFHEVKKLTNSERDFYSGVVAFMIGRKSSKALNQKIAVKSMQQHTKKTVRKQSICLKLNMGLTKAFSKGETQMSKK